MRILILLITFLAVPALASAQQADDVDTDLVPEVQLQESTQEAATAPATSVDAQEAPIAPTSSERTVDTEDNAIQQGPRSTSWWWLVGAIVVGGIILAVLL